MALTEEGLIRVEGLCSRWVRLPGGVKAHYVTAGETGPAVVLLHGGIIGSSGTAGWRFMAPYLASSGFRVYCPDLPAYGLTEDPGGFYPPGRPGHVDFCHDFATALGLERFHLAGNSMGCNNAVNYVMAHPERVISLALIAGSVGDVVPGSAYDRLLAELEWQAPAINLFDGTKESMRKMMEAIVYRDRAVSDDLLEMRTLAANKQRKAYERHVAANRDEDPSVSARLSTRGRIDKLTIPAIYLFGRQDVLRPVQTGYLQEDALPNVQFFYPDECGHQGQTDQPEMFNEVLLEFFRDGRVSRKVADWAGVSGRRPELAGVVEA